MCNQNKKKNNDKTEKQNLRIPVNFDLREL